MGEHQQQNCTNNSQWDNSSSSCSQDSEELCHLMPPVTRPVDLATDRRNNQVEKTVAVNEPDAAKNAQEGAERDLFERNEFLPVQRRREVEVARSSSPPTKRRKRNRPYRMNYNVADVIVRRVLNKVRRARNISSLQALMSLPQGRARRSKHDDITASVVDLSAFVS